MKNVFFDLDGTLTNSALGIIKSIAYALEKLGKPVPDKKTLELFIGPPLLDSYMKISGLTKEEGEKGIILFREYYGVKGIYENSLYSDILELLEELKKREIAIYLTTSKPEDYAKRILKHFKIDSYFLGVYGASDDEKMSEKEYIIKRALETIQPKPALKETLMVGDREYDILGATKNGLKSVGVLYGFGSLEELKKAKASYLIEKPLDLLNYV